MLFTARCYKIMTTISTGDKAFIMDTVILDTRAGFSLVREYVLPTSLLGNKQKICASMNAVGDTTFGVGGVIQLTFEIGGHKASTVFWRRTETCN